MRAPATRLDSLLTEVRDCRRCENELAPGPKPVLQCTATARILIAGQAPGIRVHESGIPFDDASGDRLRDWIGIDKATFYDATRIAILPMAFCYPGRGPSGDLPPPARCAPSWRDLLLDQLGEIRLTIALGKYAQDWHCGDRRTLTDRVSDWRNYWPELLPLPHPSPRNNPWLKKNPWFETEVLPALRARIARLINSQSR